MIRSNLSLRKTAQGSATATARRSGFATAAGFAARRSAAATVTVEQTAQAAQDAAAAGLAARIAAARLATAAGLSGATTARLFSSGAAGLSGTTAAGFAATSFFAATRLAAIMLVEQVEQAAAVTAAVVATTTMTEESRSAIGARQHRGNAQDQRHQTKTNVHRGDSYTNSNGEGNTRLRHATVRTAELPPATRGKCRRLEAQRRIAALAGAPTLESSSPAIVYAVRKALPTRRFCQVFQEYGAKYMCRADCRGTETVPCTGAFLSGRP